MITENKREILISEANEKSKYGNFSIDMLSRMSIESLEEISFVVSYLMQHNVTLIKSGSKEALPEDILLDDETRVKIFSSTYEYTPVDSDYAETVILEERKKELLSELDFRVSKGNVALFEILEVTQDDVELQYIYDYLLKEGMTIGGNNPTLAGELPHYRYIPKVGQDYIPDRLDEDVENDLWTQLENVTDEDRRIEIRNKIVESNMRLVKWVASKVLMGVKVPDEDKVMMGMIGLINAVENFDVSKGNKFSTYATKAIINGIYREVEYENQDGIRVKKTGNDLVREMRRIKDELRGVLEEEPSNEDIAEIMGVSIEKLEQIKEYEEMKAVTSLEEILEDGRSLREEDYDIRYTGSSDMVETVSEGVYIDNENVPDSFLDFNTPDKKVRINQIKKEIRNWLEIDESIIEKINYKPNRNIEVMFYRFGFFDGEVHSLEETARTYNISYQRARQIIDKYIRTFRMKPLIINEFGYYRDYRKKLDSKYNLNMDDM